MTIGHADKLLILMTDMEGNISCIVNYEALPLAMRKTTRRIHDKIVVFIHVYHFFSSKGL
ncbi:hypothetical protein [Prevotella amnii]|uniref:hypothetical protein n=1 Tax=Prevotella amnii TaxID=419005 RepID=UPI001E568ABB|nr:hypothetical protein [Prevotella amnii]